MALLEYRYDCPFKFTGKIDKLRFKLGPFQYTADDKKQAADAIYRARLKKH